MSQKNGKAGKTKQKQSKTVITKTKEAKCSQCASPETIENHVPTCVFLIVYAVMGFSSGQDSFYLPDVCFLLRKKKKAYQSI